MGDLQRREFHDALLDAQSFEDLPGKWQAAIVKAEQNRPKLRVVTSHLLAPAGWWLGSAGLGSGTTSTFSCDIAH
jgi:hypothetical protein